MAAPCLDISGLTGYGVEALSANEVAFGIITLTQLGDEIRRLDPLGDSDWFLRAGWIALGHDFDTTDPQYIWWSAPIHLNSERTFFTFGFTSGGLNIQRGSTHMRYHLSPGCEASVLLYAGA